MSHIVPVSFADAAPYRYLYKTEPVQQIKAQAPVSLCRAGIVHLVFQVCKHQMRQMSLYCHERRQPC